MVAPAGIAPGWTMPVGLSPAELMERKLLTQKNRGLYKLRSQTVEPVFGQVEDIRGCDRFMRGGIGVCKSEWFMICASHNLLKLCPERHAGIKSKGECS